MNLPMYGRLSKDIANVYGFFIKYCFESVFYSNNMTLPFIYGCFGSGMEDLQKEVKLSVVSDLT